MAKYKQWTIKLTPDGDRFVLSDASDALAEMFIENMMNPQDAKTFARVASSDPMFRIGCESLIVLALQVNDLLPVDAITTLTANGIKSGQQISYKYDNSRGIDLNLFMRLSEPIEAEIVKLALYLSGRFVAKSHPRWQQIFIAIAHGHTAFVQQDRSNTGRPIGRSDKKQKEYKELRRLYHASSLTKNEFLLEYPDVSKSTLSRALRPSQKSVT